MQRAVRLLIRRLGFLLLRTSRLFERVSRALTYASFTAAELGALQVSEWEAFGEHGPFVDHQLFAWEIELFAKHILPLDRMLVVGAGSGRDVLPFLAGGHEVTALDIAPRALSTLSEKAKARGQQVATIQASIAEADLPPTAFDVILFSWFCFSYLRGVRERRTALERCLAALRRKGRILISYPLRTALDSPESRVSWLGRTAARLFGGAEVEPGDAFNVSGTFGRPSVFFSHSFAPGDIEEEARRAGLEIVVHAQPASAVGVMVLTRRWDVQ